MASGIFGGEARGRARRVVRPVAPALADALDAQNARYAPSATRDAHLAALRSGAAAVVTGQQAGLFLGPLFTVYKAATTIRLARALAEEWGVPVVPVFWLQTEDHDLPEIAHCHVAPSRGATLRLELPASDDHVSVAHRVLPEGITACLNELRDDLSHLPHAGAHLARLERHYRPGAGWGEAFAGVLSELFAEEGLVLLDPRDQALAPLAAPVHRRAIVDARPIAEALIERVRALAAAGVHVRAAAPLSFFHPDGPEGRRYRLVATEGGYAEVGGTRVHTEGALLAALESRPLCFSTSALLRPILQDTWLPTAAYVGGPAEVAYFEQMGPLYAAFELPMPLVVPRLRLRLLGEKPRRLLARLKLSADQACLPEDEALAAARGQTVGGTDGAEVSQRLLETFDAAVRDLVPTLRAAGEGIDEAIEKTRGTVARAVGKLGEKYDKARLHRDQSTVEEVRRLQAWIYPEGKPQERVYGVSYFAAKHGERAFIDRIVAAAEPFDAALKDIEL